MSAGIKCRVEAGLACENLEDARLPFIRITHAKDELACRTAWDAVPLG